MIFTFNIYFKHAKQSLISFIVDYYTRENLVQMYSGLIYLVFHPDDWDILESVRSKIVNPPIIRTSAGRPKTKRIPLTEKKGKRQQQLCLNVGRWVIIVLNARTMFPLLMPAHFEVNQIHNSQVEDQWYAQFVDNLDALDKTISQHMLVLMRMKMKHLIF